MASKELMMYKYVPASIFLGVVLLYSALSKPSALIDIAVSAGFFAVLYFYNKKSNMSSIEFSLVFFAIIMHLLGSIGMYSHFIFFERVGYDKLVHFVSSFAIAYTLSRKSKPTILYYGLIILAVMGLGALVEINEFIGSRYLGIKNEGIFTIEDKLPVKSDLQRYDTYFDMLFNLAGALAAIFFAALQERYALNQPNIAYKPRYMPNMHNMHIKFK